MCITQHDVQKLVAHTNSTREFISQIFKDFVEKKKPEVSLTVLDLLGKC